MCVCVCVLRVLKSWASSIWSFESDLLPKFPHRKLLMGSRQVTQPLMVLSVPICTISEEHVHFSVCCPLSAYPPGLVVITATVHAILKVSQMSEKQGYKAAEPLHGELCLSPRQPTPPGAPSI